jgi:xanthine dehydrogenase molybdopterin-binding subunit B
MRSGVAKIVRHSIVEDIGNVLNPVLAHGQIQGGGLEPQTRNLASIPEGRARTIRPGHPCHWEHCVAFAVGAA